MNKYNWREEIEKNKKANIISSEEGLSDVTPLSEYEFMDEFIEWLENRGETFFGLTYKLKEEEE